jgi:hypothetical protein
MFFAIKSYICFAVNVIQSEKKRNSLSRKKLHCDGMDLQLLQFFLKLTVDFFSSSLLFTIKVMLRFGGILPNSLVLQIF